jgi:hypothetical protein
LAKHAFPHPFLYGGLYDCCLVHLD